MQRKLLRPDRVVFPATGFRKSDAFEYYERIAPALLPHLRSRPISFKRYPATVDDESFWEKDVPPWAPKFLKTVAVPRRSGKSFINYVVINDVRSLLAIIDLGGLELHPFLHRVPNVANATEVVFDLDPGDGAGILECAEVALLLREALRALGLESLPKVSGSKGIQVYVPLNTKATHDATEAFARAVGERLAREFPDRVVAKMAKSLRRRKVFVDYSQNADFKTTVSVYSLRAKGAIPYVSVPVEWKEITRALRTGKKDQLYFEPDKTLQRVKRRGDLFEPVLKVKQRLPKEFVAALAKTTMPKRAPKANEEDESEVVINGVRLPQPRSQSGRRLFVLPKTDQAGDELWLDRDGMFHRWILRADRRGGGRMIAMPAGKFRVAASYFRGEVQPEYAGRVTIEDIGAWEIIDGSFESESVALFFEGNALRGEWLLEKLEKGSEHRSWGFAPRH